MADNLTTAQRKRAMTAVKSKNTTAELRVRRLVTSMGFRYRLHGAKLPGKPDLVFASRKKVIFVHGCFWHQHSCHRGNRVPKIRLDYWQRKLERNQRRDVESQKLLRRSGWKVLLVWECETTPSKINALSKKLIRFLQPK